MLFLLHKMSESKDLLQILKAYTLIGNLSQALKA
jgi:hypothetical protein